MHVMSLMHIHFGYGRFFTQTSLYFIQCISLSFYICKYIFLHMCTFLSLYEYLSFFICISLYFFLLISFFLHRSLFLSLLTPIYSCLFHFLHKRTKLFRRGQNLALSLPLRCVSFFRKKQNIDI